MTRSIARAAAVALAALAIYEGIALIDFLAFCAHRGAWRRVTEHRSAVILDSGFGVARPGDAIYACTAPHCFGPVACHEDLECVCAPAALGDLALANLRGGSCVVDQPHPSRGDAGGACRFARCDEHVGP